MQRRRTGTFPILPILLAAGLAAAGCPKKGDGSAVNIDGSSTVFPITQAVAEEFAGGRDTRVTVGVSGTGGGFKKLCRGEVHLIGASRPVKPTEIEKCAEAGIEFIELPVAYDGIAVVAHPDNDWAEELTVAELETIWQPDAQDEITSWSQVREGWPEKDLNLYGPGVDSGTYDYFTHAIVGEEGASRGDFTSSEDDNVLVQGVATDEGAVGFFGFAYYAENEERLQVLPISKGEGLEAVAPSQETISAGTYQPLTRPLFIYVRKKAADEAAVAQFVEYFLKEGAPFVGQTGYVALSDEGYGLALERFEERVTGSMFDGGSQIGVTAEDLLTGS